MIKTPKTTQKKKTTRAQAAAMKEAALATLEELADGGDPDAAAAIAAVAERRRPQGAAQSALAKVFERCAPQPLEWSIACEEEAAKGSKAAESFQLRAVGAILGLADFGARALREEFIDDDDDMDEWAFEQLACALEAFGGCPGGLREPAWSLLAGLACETNFLEAASFSLSPGQEMAIVSALMSPPADGGRGAQGALRAQALWNVHSAIGNSSMGDPARQEASALALASCLRLGQDPQAACAGAHGGLFEALWSSGCLPSESSAKECARMAREAGFAMQESHFAQTCRQIHAFPDFDARARCALLAALAESQPELAAAKADGLPLAFILNQERGLCEEGSSAAIGADELFVRLAAIGMDPAQAWPQLTLSEACRSAAILALAEKASLAAAGVEPAPAPQEGASKRL